MIRWVSYGSVLYLLLAVPPASLFAQFNSSTNRTAESSTDPRVRRANRENAVAAIGPQARDFVETYGDDAVAAIFACSKAVAVKLAEFHTSGELGKLPRPRDLLRVIANPRHRDDVALWAIQHAGELTDTDSFDAYLARPLEYALGLKPLQAGAAQARAARLDPTVTAPAPAAVSKSLLDDDRLGFACFVGLLVIIGVGCWRRKRATSS